MMLGERILCFGELFNALQNTNSRLEKEREVELLITAFPELKDDWMYILETLNGQHPIGWTFRPKYTVPRCEFNTVKDLINHCLGLPRKDVLHTSMVENEIGFLGEFLAPIVNRTLRLGIGKSLLEKTDITPMLAKKYEGGFLVGDFVVTEKLDGNRCIASFNKVSNQWEFYSRSGKPMKVNFSMDGFDPGYIYDGEVMSDIQTELSVQRYSAIFNDMDFAHKTFDAQLQFNRTSGLINSSNTNKKGLVYNVFDVIAPGAYHERRSILNTLNPMAPDVRILPTLYTGHDMETVKMLLGRMTQMGGEGIMLNRIDRGYEHKRSDALLKYKQVQYMDMRVTGWYEGTGKYAGWVGGLHCTLTTADGTVINCDVGSGLSDAQRMEWAVDSSRIVGKIVQIGYHEVTQNEENIGTNVYSLRFPRLIKVRTDKTTTSEF